MTKKMVTATLFIFWAFVVAVSAAALVNSNHQSSLVQNSQIAPGSMNNTLNSAANSGTTSKAIGGAVTTGKGIIKPITNKQSTVKTVSGGTNQSGISNANNADSGLAQVKVISSKSISSIPTPISTPVIIANIPVPTPVPTSVNVGLTTSVVATHNSANDCWVIVQGNVYNLTSFLGQHSGGSGAILPYCGQDGTNAFLTKDQSPTRSHRSGDISILASYLVGPLN